MDDVVCLNGLRPWPVPWSVSPCSSLWTLLAAAVAVAAQLVPLGEWPCDRLVAGLDHAGDGLGLHRPFRQGAGGAKPALLGVAFQFLVMPFLAALVAWLLDLAPPLAVGLILVGCCPGGAGNGGH